MDISCLALVNHMNSKMYHSYVWCRHPWKIITGFCTFELSPMWISQEVMLLILLLMLVVLML